MITKLRRQMIFMVMGVVTVLLMAIFLILYHSAVSGFETRSVEAAARSLAAGAAAGPWRWRQHSTAGKIGKQTG